MASTLNPAEMLRTSDTADRTSVSEATRLARVCALDEAPGLVFGLMTLIYIIQSLAKLVP